MKTQRQKFEDWFSSEVDGSVIAESLCWQAWQAAIESVVVELPNHFNVKDVGIVMGAAGACNAVLVAGVKYK